MSDPAAASPGDTPSLMDELVRPPRLLVVDGRPQRAEALTAAFSDDYQVDIAATAGQALQACVGHAPDLLLVDAGLIDGGAGEICRRLRTQTAHSAPPVIIVTEPGDQLAQIEALEAGAADFIERPIHPSILQSRVWAQVTIRRQAELLRQWVYIDGLTGSCNRRHFDERLAGEWGRAVRQGMLLSVLRIDLDCFARYNLHHGNARGDECLRRVAAMLRASLKRPGDLVARYGGGEFICLLPDTDLEGGLDLAHRLGIQVRALAIAHTDSDVAPVVTVSMGLATKPVDVVGSVALLLRESAAQLQVAKARGRNQSAGAELDDV